MPPKWLPMMSPITSRIAKRAGLVGLVLLALIAGESRAWAACSGSSLTWTCPAGSTIAHVQAVLDTLYPSTDGATITFAAGSYDWSTGTPIYLYNTYGVTLICATEAACTVTNGYNTIQFYQLAGENTFTYRISGFAFSGGGTVFPWYPYTTGVTRLNNCRIDHNTFTNIDSGSTLFSIGQSGVGVHGKFKCVIDHNTITATDNHNVLTYIGPGSTDDPQQYAASVRGTADNIFFEYNTVTFTNMVNAGAGCVDLLYQASVVVRFNTFTNCLTTAHGVTHGPNVNYEYYNNTQIRTTGSGGSATDCIRCFHHQGSGEIMIFRNTFTPGSLDTLSAFAIEMTHYRSATAVDGGYDAALGRCDGTSVIDGNVAPTITLLGYPCWMQPGRAPAGGSPIYGTLSPVYVWQNVDSQNGNKVDVAVDDPWSGPPYPTDHVQANRDYYNAVSKDAQTSASSPFNGTTGMGYGTLANRPTTCTTNPDEAGGGVGYWATDQGSWNTSGSGGQGLLYRCSATNTWTLEYTPYDNPHPLAGAEPSASAIVGVLGRTIATVP